MLWERLESWIEMPRWYEEENIRGHYRWINPSLHVLFSPVTCFVTSTLCSADGTAIVAKNAALHKPNNLSYSLLWDALQAWEEIFLWLSHYLTETGTIEIVLALLSEWHIVCFSIYRQRSTVRALAAWDRAGRLYFFCSSLPFHPPGTFVVFLHSLVTDFWKMCVSFIYHSCFLRSFESSFDRTEGKKEEHR